MGFSDQVKKISLTPQHLIIEEKFTTSPLFDSVSPSWKFKGVKILGAKHKQVMRRVVTLARYEDVYFKGKKLPGMPSNWQLLEEMVTPGQQITTRPNGKLTLSLTYVGKFNTMSGVLAGSAEKSVSLGRINYLGEDPAPNAILHTNAAIPFIQFGNENLIAAAYYNANVRRLEYLTNFNVRTIGDEFMARFSAAYS